MRQLIIIIICVMSAISAEAQSLNSDKYISLVAEADSLMSLEKWQEAEKKLTGALHCEPANPGNCMLLSNLGIVLNQEGRYEDAVRHFDVALTMNPNSFIALKNRGIAHLAREEAASALADFSRAIEVDSTDIDVYGLRGLTYMYRGDVKGATSDFKKVLKERPQDIDALEGMARCSRITGKSDEALSYYTQLIELKPDVDYYFSRGMLRAQGGNLADASADVKEGMLLDPQNANLYLLRAYIEHLSYRNNDAQDSLKLARKYGADERQIEAILNSPRNK